MCTYVDPHRTTRSHACALCVHGRARACVYATTCGRADAQYIVKCRVPSCALSNVLYICLRRLGLIGHFEPGPRAWSRWIRCEGAHFPTHSSARRQRVCLQRKVRQRLVCVFGSSSISVGTLQHCLNVPCDKLTFGLRPVMVSCSMCCLCERTFGGVVDPHHVSRRPEPYILLNKVHHYLNLDLGFDQVFEQGEAGMYPCAHVLTHFPDAACSSCRCLT